MNDLQHQASGNYVSEGTIFQWVGQEKDLVNWWVLESEKQSTLKTSTGEHLIILDAGKRNDGPGPDISDCHLILDDLELVGDVEMHWRARDWYSHRHDQDPNYGSVILHVVAQGSGGPDLATLIVNQGQVNRSDCHASRPITQSELLELSWYRFLRKAHHIDLLSRSSSEFSPLLLGMLEIIYAGKQRHKRLQTVALQLGLSLWPDARKWRGSNQSFQPATPPGDQLAAILNQAELFNEHRWRARYASSWAAWDRELLSMNSLGLSRNQTREWVVNILIPAMKPDKGFKLWMDTEPFRHYGIEKHLIGKLGLNGITNVAIQQACLEWQEHYCSKSNCTICPLSRSPQVLA